MRLKGIKCLHRLLAMLLCTLIVFSVCDTVPFSWAQPSEATVETSLPEETQDEIRARLLHQIRYEGWDPYSADMTLEEFYVLMELFQDGSLPIEAETSTDVPGDRPVIGVPGMDAPGVEEPGIDTPGIAAPGIDDPETEDPAEEEEPLYIPRSMFLFSGLKEYEGDNQPLAYDDETGSDEDDYPAGLDPYKMGYLRPPLSWEGVLTADEQKAIVIVPDQNNGDPTIAGDVDQGLFIEYDGYYVRRVTVQNSEATILGAIKLPGQNEYVYYYLTDSDQSTDVSTTTLPKGQKFIVQYNTREHHMNYEVRMNDVVNGEDVTAQWVNYIFGADRPTGTTDGYYSFVATAPYGYEMRIFRLVAGNTKPEEITGPDSATGITHNEGYPLGREPVYDIGSGFRLNINPDKGPSTLMMSDTFYNASVDADRTIIAVLTKRDDPMFDAATIITKSSGTPGRGSSAVRFVTATNRATGKTETIPYDYEDEYLWRKYGMNGSSKYINYNVANAIGNITTGDGWGWKSDSITLSQMDKNGDGTYSYQWTFQTNSSSGGYLMDVLEVNGVPLTLPFLPKYSENGEATGTDKPGIRCWYREYTLPHNINVKIEFLMAFNTSPTQRVYRVTVTNARSNVTITGMNLMQYTTGAPEISTYDMSGIYADATDGGETDTSQAAIQYYCAGGAWSRAAVSNVIVNEDGKDDRFDYTNGDPANHGANIRFRLADGYDSPYYLFESSRDGIIPGTDGKEQASVTRDEDGNIDISNQTAILKMSELADGDQLDSQYIYDGGDGWYYIRVTQQDPHRMALLTIGAREVKYVVRYLPSYPDSGEGEPQGALTWEEIGDPDNLEKLPNGTFAGIVQNPQHVPEFEHIDGKCHPSFHKTTDNGIPGQHYDDKNGDYYDTVSDTVALVPLDVNSLPTDPKNGYMFVDWVLVDENYQVITDSDGNEIHYLGNPITISEINEYAIKNDGLGDSSVDVYVLRLMPTWRKVENPFNYKVALRWIDAQGILNEKYFQGDWRDVLTDWDINTGGSLTVKVLKDATPFLDWIAQHPTYVFWDDVNNAVNDPGYDPDNPSENARSAEAKIIESLGIYLPELLEASRKDDYDKAVDALLTMDVNENGDDDFVRLGNYAYQVKEDDGTIVIWMNEDKGGLVFHKEVQDEPFSADDEFYFTVTDIMVGENNDTPLNGTYKAYPEKVYDSNGKERKILDKDAWVVTVKNGSITSIVKNDGSPAPDPPVTYFTLKDGEGIMLYAAPGQYTIAELGSKSGGNYKVKVTYTASNGSVIPDENWDIPDEKDLWLQGSKKQYYEQSVPSGVQQVAATVDFDIGEKYVVQTLTFCNQTCSLAVEVFLRAQAGVTIPNVYLNKDYTFNVALNLPADYTPLQNGDEYYFNLVIYNTKNGTMVEDTTIIMKQVVQDAEGLPSDMPDGMSWIGEIKLKADQRAVIVMNVPDQGGKVNYWASEVVDWKNTVTKKLTPQYSTLQTGTVQAAECAEVSVVNWYSALPDNGYLVITEKGGKAGETFLYKITDANDKELIVSVIIGQDGTGETVVECPLGVYTVKEITNWAWRYEDGQCVNQSPVKNTATVIVESTHTETSPAHADFTNKRNTKVWLGSENNKKNFFGIF